MLRVTDPQLENLMFLRDVTIPWMRENPERVDFNMFNSDCGTYGCLLGWFCVERYGTGYLDSSLNENEAFGIDDETWVRLFDTCDVGTLDDRARYIDELIAQRLVALEAR